MIGSVLIQDNAALQAHAVLDHLQLLGVQRPTTVCDALGDAPRSPHLRSASMPTRPGVRVTHEDLARAAPPAHPTRSQNACTPAATRAGSSTCG